jgi:hypothetical protein
MDAASRFHHGAFRVELDHNIVKVAGAFIRRAQVQIKKWAISPFLAVDRQKFTGNCLHSASNKWNSYK